MSAWSMHPDEAYTPGDNPWQGEFADVMPEQGACDEGCGDTADCPCRDCDEGPERYCEACCVIVTNRQKFAASVASHDDGAGVGSHTDHTTVPAPAPSSPMREAS